MYVIAYWTDCHRQLEGDKDRKTCQVGKAAMEAAEVHIEQHANHRVIVGSYLHHILEDKWGWWVPPRQERSPWHFARYRREAHR